MSLFDGLPLDDAPCASGLLPLDGPRPAPLWTDAELAAYRRAPARRRDTADALARRRAHIQAAATSRALEWAEIAAVRALTAEIADLLRC